MIEGSLGIYRVATAILITAALVWITVGASLAQEQAIIDSGKLEFDKRCAVCHGLDARGNGPLASQLKTKPADLTQISKKNEGQFPFWQMYRTVDGRDAVEGHGTREMPVWGDNFLEEAGVDRRDAEAEVRGRILTLLFYLQSFQEK